VRFLKLCFISFRIKVKVFPMHDIKRRIGGIVTGLH
jgi:hypothetical protein